MLSEQARPSGEIRHAVTSLFALSLCVWVEYVQGTWTSTAMQGLGGSSPPPKRAGTQKGQRKVRTRSTDRQSQATPTTCQWRQRAEENGLLCPSPPGWCPLWPCRKLVHAVIIGVPQPVAGQVENPEVHLYLAVKGSIFPTCQSSVKEFLIKSKS